MLFEFRVPHSEFTFLYHPSTALEVRCASSTFNITYLANRSSCRSCLRRCCTSTSLQSFLQSWSRSDVTCSQFDLQTSTWFGCSVEDSSRTLSHLVRRLRCKPSLRICFRKSCSSGSSQQLQLVLFDMAELSRPMVRSPA